MGKNKTLVTINDFYYYFDLFNFEDIDFKITGYYTLGGGAVLEFKIPKIKRYEFLKRIGLNIIKYNFNKYKIAGNYVKVIER